MIEMLRLMMWRWQHRRHAWALRSKSYMPDSELVGLFSNRKAAERYATKATPPVTDAIIEEWHISGV